MCSQNTEMASLLKSLPDLTAAPDRILSEAQYHRLSAYLFYSDYYRDEIDLQSKLKVLYQNQVIRSLAQLSELKTIANSLNVLQIPFLVLKGLPLSFYLYSNPYKRISKDIDLFIDSKQIEKVHEIFHKQGYQSNYDINLFNKQFDKLKQIRNDLIYTKGAVIFEVHFQLSYQIQSFKPFSYYWSRKQTQQFFDSTINIFDSDSEFLYLCYHGGKHAWQRFQWLIDIKKYCEKQNYNQSDYVRLFSLAKEQGIVHYLELALLLLKKHFHFNMDYSLSKKLLARFFLNQTQMAMSKLEQENKCRVRYYFWRIGALSLLSPCLSSIWLIFSVVPKQRYWPLWIEKEKPDWFFYFCYPLSVLRCFMILFRRRCNDKRK